MESDQLWNNQQVPTSQNVKWHLKVFVQNVNQNTLTKKIRLDNI